MSRETDLAEAVAAARATRGGHLSVGPAGCTLHWAEEEREVAVPGEDGRPAHAFRTRSLHRLSGADPARLKGLCLAAGVPVLDCSGVPFDVAWSLVARGPMVAVAAEPDPPPWHAFAHAPLAHVAALYRAAGAEALNIPDHP